MSRRPLASAALSVLIALAALVTVTRASAKTPRASSASSASSAASASPAAAPSADTDPGEAEPELPWKDGPQVIDLGHGATMALPEGRRFLGMPDAGKVMEKLGNLNTETLLGIAVASGGANYLVSIRYEEDGFIKDDEAIDPKAILESIRSGEKEYNEERKQRGFPPIHADGWSEEPRYDKTAHELVWALLVSSSGDPSVNLNTRVLGRKGHVAVNLIAAPEDLPRYRDDGLALVKATTFRAGSRYEDYNKSTDKVAEYGLAGLILGGVGLGVVKVAKVGVLAAFWKPILAFLLAAKKAVLIGIAAVVGYFRKLFGRREKTAPPAA